jgi:hypothetical protein
VSREKLVSDMGRRGFDRMRSLRAATMIALASATGQARPRHAATSPGWEECPEQADLRVVALMAKTALSSA